MKLRAAVTALLCIFLLSACGAPAAKEESPAPEERTPIVLPEREKSAYPQVKVYYDSLLSDRGLCRDGVLYMCPEALCACFGLSGDWELREDGFEFCVADIRLKYKAGDEFMRAEGRYFYTPGGYIEEKGRLYLPQDVLERLFGVSFSFDEEALSAVLEQGALNLLRGGENYYVDNFPADELYWLSRIIYAESREQPLAGQIGVGNVVYNRVESDKFPHTVIDVIYQRDGTIQFDPTAAGALGEPDEMSTIAACLAMEGYNTVGDCMFFVNPDRGDSSWFEKELEFVVSLGDHDFYRSKDNA